MSDPPYPPNTKNIEVQWSSAVTRADPDWQRDHRLQPELYPHGLPKKRAAVKHDWQKRGPYEP